jgi:hypothetical protein
MGDIDMNDLFEEYEALRLQLTNYYQYEMSLALDCHTLPVKQQEVELVKALLLLVGGKEAQQAMRQCWNRARQGHPQIYPAREDFPLCREGWNTRGVRREESVPDP